MFNLKVIMWKDLRGEWRWKAQARNNRSVAVSGEGYTKKAHCRRMVIKLFGVVPQER